MVEDEIRADFDRVRHKALLGGVLDALAGRSNDLIPFHEVRHRLSPDGESYRGLRSVPVAGIVGSMDRAGDFDRAFRPRRRHTASRWQSVDRAHYEGTTLPPISLYQLGDVYFVQDGNHRVSVARQQGQQFIDAEVVEGHVRLPFCPEMPTPELLLQAEYANFLRRTDLDRLRPDHDIRPTALGRYPKLWARIEAHQARLVAARRRPVPTAESVADWYDRVYCPIAVAIDRQRLLDRMPGQTVADLFLMAMDHQDRSTECHVSPIDPTAVVADAAAQGRGRRGLLARWGGIALRPFPAAPSSPAPPPVDRGPTPVWAGQCPCHAPAVAG